MEDTWRWAILTALATVVLPMVIYYSFGRRYDRVRPVKPTVADPDSGPTTPTQQSVGEEEPGDSTDDDAATDECSGEFLPAFLSSIKLFGFMDRNVFDLLATHLQERRCVAGEVILEMDRQGKVDRSFYVVVEGRVEMKIPDSQQDIVSAALSDLTSTSQAMHSIGPGGTVSSLFSILSIFAEHDVGGGEDRSGADPDGSGDRLGTDTGGSGDRLGADTDTGDSSIRPVFPNLHSGGGDQRQHGTEDGALVARAVVATRLLMIPEQAFHRLAMEFPAAAAHITSVVLTRFQRVTFLSLYRYLGLARELAAMESDINHQDSGSGDTVIRAKREYLVGLSAESRDRLILDTCRSIVGKLHVQASLAPRLAPHVDLRYLEPGEVLVQHGTRNPGLFHVVSGLVEGRANDGSVIYASRAGLCGTLAAFLGHSSFIDIVAREETIVAVLTRPGVQSLVRQDPTVMFRLAKRLLGRLSPIVKSVDLLLEWRHLNAGRVLVRAGDPIEGIYIVLAGRFRNLTRGLEYGQGDVIGATALLTGTTHRSTAVAVRDSEYACMPRSLFDLLSRSFPSLALFMSRNLAARQLGDPRVGLAKTISILPAADSVPVREFAERLRDEMIGYDTCQLLDSSAVGEALGKDAFAPIGKLRLSEYFTEQEESHRAVILLADPSLTPWTKRCIRQADFVLVVACASDGHHMGRVERAYLGCFRKMGGRKELVLLHSRRLCPPGTAVSWLKARPWLATHHHVYWEGIADYGDGSAGPDSNLARLLPSPLRHRLDRPVPRASTAPSDDFGRLARHLLNRSVGVVLSGGGARGVAHVGALRAICEAGIPIDVIGGTSMGAFVAGLYASDADWLTLPSRVRFFCIRAGSWWRWLGDLTWPYCSWFTGHSLNRALWKLFGHWMVDDLWLRYFCVTTDISTSRKAVHRADGGADDYIWRYVRASMSLSGLVPPVCDRAGHMHVDGGYVSTVPVEVLQDEFSGIGTIIVVDVSAVYNDPGRFKIGDAVSGVVPALRQLLGMSPIIPSLGEIQTRISFVSSDVASRSRQQAADPGILVIRPPVRHVNIMDFGRYQEITRLGYEEALRAIEGWRSAGQPIPQQQPRRHRRRSF